MNRALPFIVTTLLALSSLWAGIDSYRATEKRIADELTQALTLTALEQPTDWLSTDTIRTFRSHLQTAELRDNAYLAFCLMDEQRQRARGTIASDTLAVGDVVRAQGYATCSAFTIWWMSDQRLSLALALLALLSFTMALLRFQRSTRLSPTPLISKNEQRFLAASDCASLFTPMQEQLLDLFMASPTHELTKQEICDALWPKKPNASETLYTLIHRIKPTLEEHTEFRITSNRGRSYRLERKA